MKVVLYSIANHGRAGHIATAMRDGLRRHGIAAEIKLRWNGQVAGDVAIAYGWKHEPVFSAYREAGGHYAYFDMGYFNRKPGKDKGGNREGHHRLAVDSWDTADTMIRGCPLNRWLALGIEIQPIRPDFVAPDWPGAVLVAGMSDKAAKTHGFLPGQWERDTVAALAPMRVATGRQVILRAKPTHIDAVAPIEDVLRGCALIVTHHSNVAVDGLVAGVPCHAVKGVGKLVSLKGGYLASPHQLQWTQPTFEARRQLLADVAYAQWTPEEMRTGEAWEHIRRVIDDGARREVPRAVPGGGDQQADL